MRIPSFTLYTSIRFTFLLLFALDAFSTPISHFSKISSNPLPSSQDTLVETICDGDSLLLLNGAYAYTTGLYSNTFTASSGLDSIVYIQLTVAPPISFSQSVSVCPGDTFWFDSLSFAISAGSYQSIYPAANGCDSTVFTTVSFLPSSSDTTVTFFCTGGSYTLSNGQVVTQAGVYTVSYTNVFGCDSNRVFNVFVENTVDLFASLSICQGTTSTIAGPSNIQVSSAGVYVDSVDINGCLVFLITTVTVRPSYFSSATVHICPGDSFQLENGNTVFNSGTYNVSFTTVGGCDSVFQTTLLVDSFPIPTFPIDLCAGDTFLLPSGKLVSFAGIHQDTLNSVLGCDSILAFDISVRPTFFIQNAITICVNDSVTLPGGAVVNQSGTYTDTLSSSFGCDSVIETIVQSVTSFFGFVSTQMCQGDTLTLPSGNLVLGGGTYHDTLQSVAFCDSVVEFSVIEFPTYNFGVTDSVHLCMGDTLFLLNGNYLTTTSFFSQTLQTVNGCDSSFNSHALFWPNSNTNQSFTICPGDSVQLPNGSFETSSGVYHDTLTNHWGCDSVVTTAITVETIAIQQVMAGYCQGQSYTLPSGGVVSQAGIYLDTISSALGCDSVLSIQLTEHPSYSITDSSTLCLGESYVLPNGVSVNSAGIYVSTFQSTEGCDSIIHTTLLVDSVQYSAVQNLQSVYILANGASYQWLDCLAGFSILQGETDSIFQFSIAGSYAVQITQNGCVDTSDCFLSNISVSEFHQNSMVVYPNPGKDLYNVRLSHTEPYIHAIVLNSYGQVVLERMMYNTATFSFELEGPPGIYLLQLSTRNSTQYSRIVKVN
jgi:hypothetical protein